MSSLRIIRLTAWAAVAALVVGTAAVIGLRLTSPTDTAALTDPAAAIGGPFRLQDGQGRTVTEADFKGKPTLYYFGFTFCPEVCPTTLYEMQGWMEALGADADKLNYVFITVDPERDTPEVLKEYVSAFSTRIVGLSGSQEAIDAVTKAYHVYAKRVPLDHGDYTMDHTAAIFLMDSNNRFAGTIAYKENTDTALAKLRRLIAQAPGKA